MRIADETAIGLPTGTSSLAQVGGIAVAQLAYEILDGAPARQSGTMCVRITRRRDTQAAALLQQLRRWRRRRADGRRAVRWWRTSAAAAGQLDAYNFGPLHVTDVEVDIRLTRSLRQAFLLEARAPQSVRRGKDVRVRLRAQRVNGAKFSRYVKVHVPRGTPRGPRYLTFTGTSSDISGASDSLDLSLEDLLGGEEGDASDESGPRTLGELRAAIEGIHRTDGVTASFRPLDGGSGESPTGAEAVAQRERQVLRDSRPAVQRRGEGPGPRPLSADVAGSVSVEVVLDLQRRGLRRFGLGYLGRGVARAARGRGPLRARLSRTSR